MMPEKTELQTLKEQIDKILVVSGWTPICTYFKDIRFRSGTIKEYATANGPADYILFDNDDALAVIDTKMPLPGPQQGLEQAQKYSKGFQDGLFDFNGFHVPFAYSTDGETIWFRDLRSPNDLPRQVKNFHVRSALREMLERDTAPSIRWFQANSINMPSLRPSQIEAVRSVERAIAQNKRKMLVAMAAGTGKTYAIIALIHRLMRSGLARRVLLLVDSRALAAQARSAMASFDAEPGRKFDKVYAVYNQKFNQDDFGKDIKSDLKVLPAKYLTDPPPGMSFVYISTLKGMGFNLFGRPEEETGAGDKDGEEDAERLDVPIHAFDCIIADECHRGNTAKEVSRWRETLEFFDGIKIGFTAMPAAHTKAYYGEVVNRSLLERAKGNAAQVAEKDERQ